MLDPQLSDDEQAATEVESDSSAGEERFACSQKESKWPPQSKCIPTPGRAASSSSGTPTTQEYSQKQLNVCTPTTNGEAAASQQNHTRSAPTPSTEDEEDAEMLDATRRAWQRLLNSPPSTVEYGSQRQHDCEDCQGAPVVGISREIVGISRESEAAPPCDSDESGKPEFTGSASVPHVVEAVPVELSDAQCSLRTPPKASLDEKGTCSMPHVRACSADRAAGMQKPPSPRLSCIDEDGQSRIRPVEGSALLDCADNALSAPEDDHHCPGGTWMAWAAAAPLLGAHPGNEAQRHVISRLNTEAPSRPSDEPPSTVDQFNINVGNVSVKEPRNEVPSRPTDKAFSELDDEDARASNAASKLASCVERSRRCDKDSAVHIPGNFGGRWRRGILQSCDAMLMLSDSATSNKILEKTIRDNEKPVSKVMRRPASTGSGLSLKKAGKENSKSVRKTPANLSDKSPNADNKKGPLGKVKGAAEKSAPSKGRKDKKKVSEDKPAVSSGSKANKEQIGKAIDRPGSPKKRGRAKVQKKEECSSLTPESMKASQSSKRTENKRMLSVKEDLENCKRRKTSPFDRCASAVPSAAPKIAARGTRPCITLSGVKLPAKVERGLKKLGASIEADWTPNISLLVANEFKRTLKMMCAICSGLPILTGYYLTACELQGCWIDTRTYTLQDAIGERNFSKPRNLSSFSLSTSISRRMHQGPLLAGRTVFALAPTPKHQREELKCLVTAAGGAWSDDRLPPDPSDDDLCLVDPDTCREKSDLLKARRRAAPCALYDIELLFEACCTQQLRLDNFRL
eukprot:gnl/MRDRNA2_/MRDRNA2_106047_c0_seq1.p1 gnl/MRDRNA2_/MRDRNA2_106047_c0~~gnl/MRDRNA2_/MRDRNA2_106047_c0_seq1.p1  ORF type:complete len:799 (-),score=153.67 gnl/MRDRNA2_/MRDRNA2_106047_c0_seq1:216-2612(-)